MLDKFCQEIGDIKFDLKCLWRALVGLWKEYRAEPVYPGDAGTDSSATNTTKVTFKITN